MATAIQIDSPTLDSTQLDLAQSNLTPPETMFFASSNSVKAAKTAAFSKIIALGCTLLLGNVAGIGWNSAAIAQSSAPTSQSTLATAPGNILPPLGQAEPFLPEIVKSSEAQESAVRLVLKRGKRKVYVYQGEKEVANYPVAVGKPGWETPLGKFEVLSMEEHPIFKSFKSGRIIPPGEDNPLGVRWVGIWTDGKTQLGFHGTNEPELIGQAVSHGCIRMHNKDVMKLYQQVKMGTVVTIVP